MKKTNITIGNCTLYHGDCFDILPQLALQADAVITDPPYNNTACDWDVYIPLAHFWEIIRMKSKPSANYVLFAAGHFVIDLANSKYRWFRYDLVWQKNNKCGFLNSNKQPMRQHENILVFGQPGEINNAAYNPQKTSNSKELRRNRKISMRKGGVYPATVYTSRTDGTQHPCSVLQFDNDRSVNNSGLHPTQKPAALLEFLVRSYTNENETVLDPFMGSGTTGIASAIHGRKFIGIEKEKKYFDIAVKRISEFYEKTNV